MNTGADMATVIGRQYHYPITEQLTVIVTVLNTKRAYGRTDAQITPAAGTGVAWVDFARLREIGG